MRPLERSNMRLADASQLLNSPITPLESDMRTLVPDEHAQDFHLHCTEENEHSRKLSSDAVSSEQPATNDGLDAFRVEI